jgi:Tfp pilus assembly protein PilV
MSSIRTSLGCTLVEALVACGLSACALAATLMLQGRALAATRAARDFSVAALHASSMAAMVRANAAGWRQETDAPGALPPALQPVLKPALQRDCAQQPCDAAQLAAYDTARWRHALALTLRGAGGEVRCTERMCIVTVRWSGHTLRQSVAIDAARPPGGATRCAARARCVELQAMSASS